MKYIVLNQLNIPHLHIIDTKHCYKFKYNITKDISIFGIPIHLSNCFTKVSGNSILLYSKNIYLLQPLDFYIKKYIDNCLTLFEDKSCEFIRFNLNRFTEVLLQENPDFSINLNIKYIRKGYINKPIIHIINDNET